MHLNLKVGSLFPFADFIAFCLNTAITLQSLHIGMLPPSQQNPAWQNPLCRIHTSGLISYSQHRLAYYIGHGLTGLKTPYWSRIPYIRSAHIVLFTQIISLWIGLFLIWVFLQ